MRIDLKGIVLKKIAYSDNRIIADILTDKIGKQSFIINAGKTKQTRNKINSIQVFSPLELQAFVKDNETLAKLNDYSLLFPLRSIHYEFKRNSVAVFLAEIINKTLKENVSDQKLFEFVLTAIQILDISAHNLSNFHISFLLNYSKFLGIFPENNSSETRKIFDLSLSKFTIGIPQHQNWLDEKLSSLFCEFFKTDLSNSHLIKLDHTKRQTLLYAMLDYYNLHLSKPGKLNSLDVLRQVFEA